MRKSDCTPEKWEAYKKYQREWMAKQPPEKRAVVVARASEWNKTNAERRLEISRNHHYKTKYGLTLEEVRTMWEAQGGRCLLCKDEPKHTPNVDHCHTTGKVRGLVCSPCNTAIGHLENHPGLLEALTQYLL